MTMIKQASRAIEHMTAREMRVQRAKYARRNKMHHIDRLLNELEMLNLAERRELPQPISGAVARLLADLPGGGVACRPGSVIEAMDLLYEIQDGLMFTSPDED
jgi:hypothetical protein